MTEHEFKEEYFKRCDKLRYKILQAYTDEAILETMEHCIKENQDLKLGNDSFNVIHHYCNLAKTDYVFTIYKIYSDNSYSQTNTLIQLRSYLNSNQQFTNKIFQPVSISKFSESWLSLLDDFRDKFLAHFDLYDKVIKIEINFNILNEIKDMYNSLCDTSIDSRVKTITSQDICHIKLSKLFGFLAFISK